MISTRPGLPALLGDIFSGLPQSSILGLGGNPISGQFSFDHHIASGHGHFTCFEPNGALIENHQSRLGNNATFIQQQVLDGQSAVYYETATPSLNSTLEPNFALINNYTGLADMAAVNKTRRLDTVRLDDKGDYHLLSFHANGRETDILQQIPHLSRQALFMETTVFFIPFYREGRLFNDLDPLFRQQGYLLHTLKGLLESDFAGFQPPQAFRSKKQQLISAVAVYVKDYFNLSPYTDDQLLMMATLAHDLYQSFDLCLRYLQEVDKRQGRNLAQTYLATIGEGV